MQKHLSLCYGKAKCLYLLQSYRILRVLLSSIDAYPMVPITGFIAGSETVLFLLVAYAAVLFLLVA